MKVIIENAKYCYVGQLMQYLEESLPEYGVSVSGVYWSDTTGEMIFIITPFNNYTMRILTTAFEGSGFRFSVPEMSGFRFTVA